MNSCEYERPSLFKKTEAPPILQFELSSSKDPKQEVCNSHLIGHPNFLSKHTHNFHATLSCVVKLSQDML